ncbi:MAG: arylsulfatase [Planctomycetes bacterium]|nr:arylsulfatase [Planctomycetota bacterium]
MNQHRFTTALFLILTSSAFLSTAVAEPPNVILIMSDDQGWGDFGATGNPILKTPNIDAMAQRSASMSNFYVCPVCTPTRASLMTGRYNYRTRAFDTYVGRAMMEPQEVTVAELLSTAGYATGIFGKWHLGDCYPMRPNDQGFEESLIHRGGGLAQPSEPRENNRRYTNPILFHNGQQVQTTGYCTDVYFDAAMQFIDKAHKQQRPFFTYIATNAPHSPYHDVPEELRKQYMQEDLTSIMVKQPSKKNAPKQIDTLARIGAMITNIDDNVGRLFKKLDHLGLTENTLVIYLVDNGPNTERFVGPYRGAKTSVHEGGVRSPLWLHWPARLKPNTTRNEIAAHIDVMPTILEACQVQPDAQLALDGRSLLPLLEDKEIPWPERTIATQWHRGDQPVRYHNFMIRDSRWKLLNDSRRLKELTDPPNFELYDLVSDPGEAHNLIDQKPEIFARLKAAYDRWFDDVSSTRPDNYAPPRIVIGTPHETTTALTRQDWRSNGWAPGTTGYWLVNIAQAGRYDVQVLLANAKTGDNVRLKIGDTIVNQQAPDGSDSCQFTNLDLPAGNTQISATQTANKKSQGAYQLIITKK